MKMPQTTSILLATGLAFTLFSCANSATEQSTTLDNSPTKVSYVDLGYEQATAKLMIEGMSCERMCVSTIKKSMSTVPSVEINAMHFDAEVAIDTLIVHFDPAQVGDQQLIEAVESLVGGDTYRVREIQLSEDAKKTSCAPKRSSSSRSTKAEARSYTFSVPNPFEVLRKVRI